MRVQGATDEEREQIEAAVDELANAVSIEDLCVAHDALEDVGHS